MDVVTIIELQRIVKRLQETLLSKDDAELKKFASKKDLADFNTHIGKFVDDRNNRVFKGIDAIYKRLNAPVVAFSVRDERWYIQCISKKENVTYDKDILKSDNMNKQTGIFTVPEDGVYQFGYTISTSSTSEKAKSRRLWAENMLFGIVKNGINLGNYANFGECYRVTGGDNAGVRRTASNLVVLKLRKGDRISIYLRDWHGATSSDQMHIQSSFTGIKIGV